MSTALTVWPVVSTFSLVWVQSISALLYLENNFEIRLRKSSQMKKLKRISKLVIWGPWHFGGTWSSGAVEHLWPCSHASAVPAVGQWPRYQDITLELSVPTQRGCQSLHLHSVNKPLCTIWREQACLVSFDINTTWDLQLQPFCLLSEQYRSNGTTGKINPWPPLTQLWPSTLSMARLLWKQTFIPE